MLFLKTYSQTPRVRIRTSFDSFKKIFLLAKRLNRQLYLNLLFGIDGDVLWYKSTGRRCPNALYCLIINFEAKKLVDIIFIVFQYISWETLLQSYLLSNPMAMFLFDFGRQNFAWKAARRWGIYHFIIFFKASFPATEKKIFLELSKEVQIYLKGFIPAQTDSGLSNTWSRSLLIPTLC